MRQQLSQQLTNHPDIHDWKIYQLGKKETQWYYQGSSLEAQRFINDEYFTVTIYHDENHQALKRGKARFTLYRDQFSELSHFIEQALTMAKHSQGPAFPLPAPQTPASVVTEDRALLAPDTPIVEQALDLLYQATASQKVALATAEIFVSHIEHTLMTSTGFNQTYPSTNIYFEYSIIAQDQNQKAEFFDFVDERTLSLADFSEQVQHSVQYARDSLQPRLPRTGKWPVVFCQNCLPTFFRPFMYHSSADAFYKGLSRFKPHEPVLPGGYARGDKLTLASDGLIPLCKGTMPFDTDGIPAGRFPLIQEGKLHQFWAPYRYAHILGLPCTGYLFNLDVQPGQTPYESLIQPDARDTLYLIAALSSFEPDRFKGDFSAEIKLGYEIKNGEKTPIKGGSLSGNLFTAFEEAYFSQETMVYQNYRGPRAIRFENVTLSGT